jgi:septal ring factor EnvC (AmiA/AmiB activator)
MRPRLLLCLLLAVLVGASLAQGEDKSAREKELKTILQQIDKLKQAIDDKESSRSQYIKQLKSIEQQIGRVTGKIRAINRQIGERKTELAALRDTRERHQRQLSRENDYLAEQVYAAFTLGKQERIKLLFSQQDPERLQRNLVYYQYFSNARVALIGDVQRNIEKIVETRNSRPARHH